MRLVAPTSPGEVLLEEYLRPKGMTQGALAEKMGVHVQVVNGIVRGRRAVTAQVAWRLAAATGIGPDFWMNLQTARDLWMARPAERRPNREAVSRAPSCRV